MPLDLGKLVIIILFLSPGIGAAALLARILIDKIDEWAGGKHVKN